MSLEPHAYTLNGLDRGLYRYFNAISKNDPSLLQRAAHDRWTIWLRDTDLQSDLKLEDLHHIFVIFDDYFFAGSLNDHKDLYWNLKAEDNEFDDGTLGYCCVSNLRARIVLLKHPAGVRGRPDLQSLLGTLLHEMCHGGRRAFRMFVQGLL